MKIKNLYILALVSFSKPLTYWFDVGVAGASKYWIESMTAAGPNKAYVVQGQENKFFTFSVDWEQGKMIEEKVNQLGSNSKMYHDSHVQGDASTNVILASGGIWRFNYMKDQPENVEAYPVPQGPKDSYPFWATQTSYMFVGMQSGSTSEQNVYRVESNTISGMKTFSLGRKSRSYGVIFGTNWLVISLDGTDLRKIFDYTTGYDGGSSPAVVLETHPKASTKMESGFMTPEDPTRPYYVVGEWDTKTVYTINNIGGTQRLNHKLATFNDNISNIKWIYDTELCVVASHGKYFALVNFADQTKTAEEAITYEQLKSSWRKIYQPVVWSDKKILAIPVARGDVTRIYKILDVVPCSDECNSCDGIFRKKCSTCKPNSSPSPAQDGSCTCNSNFYDSKISFTTKECLQCS